VENVSADCGLWEDGGYRTRASTAGETGDLRRVGSLRAHRRGRP